MSLLTKERKTALIETAKEAFRIALFAGISALGLWIAQKIATVDPTTTDWLAWTFVLRLIDKYINKNPGIPSNGISPI